MDIHSPRHGSRGVTPDFFEEFVTTNDLAARLDEVLQKPAFPFRQDNDLAILRHPGFHEIDRNAVRLVREKLFSHAGPGPAQKSLDAHQKFRGLKRFGEVVIGAGFESLNLVVEFRSRGKHKDRYLDASLAKVPGNVESASRREHHVEHNEIIPVAYNAVLSLCSIRGHLDVVPRADKKILQCSAQTGLV